MSEASTAIREFLLAAAALMLLVGKPGVAGILAFVASVITLWKHRAWAYRAFAWARERIPRRHQTVVPRISPDNAYDPSRADLRGAPTSEIREALNAAAVTRRAARDSR